MKQIAIGVVVLVFIGSGAAAGCTRGESPTEPVVAQEGVAALEPTCTDTVFSPNHFRTCVTVNVHWTHTPK